eukprot:764912-Hanusia_phi.AAC.2
MLLWGRRCDAFGNCDPVVSGEQRTWQGGENIMAGKVGTEREGKGNLREVEELRNRAHRDGVPYHSQSLGGPGWWRGTKDEPAIGGLWMDVNEFACLVVLPWHELNTLQARHQ